MAFARQPGSLSLSICSAWGEGGWDPVGRKMGSVGLTAAEGLFRLFTWVALIFELRVKLE